LRALARNSAFLKNHLIEAKMSNLVLKKASLSTVTPPPIPCIEYGDNDKELNKINLTVTFIKTDKKTWEVEAEAADAAQDGKGMLRMLKSKIKDIKGLPLEDNAGNTQPYSDAAFDLIENEEWITEPLVLTLRAVNSGAKSDSMRKFKAKNF
jgi:asparagine synthetase B (glutamine-hydrolysing)